MRLHIYSGLLFEREPVVLLLVEFVEDQGFQIGVIIRILVLDIVDEEKIVPHVVVFLDMIDEPSFLLIQLDFGGPTNKALLLVHLVLFLSIRSQLIEVVHDDRCDDGHQKEDDDIEIEVVPEHTGPIDLALLDPFLVDVPLNREETQFVEEEITSTGIGLE